MFRVEGDNWQSGPVIWSNEGWNYCERSVFSVFLWLCASCTWSNSSWQNILLMDGSRLGSQWSCQLVGGACDFSTIVFICYRKVSRVDTCQLFPYLLTLSGKKACSFEFRCCVAETRLSGTLHSNQFYSAGPKSWFMLEAMQLNTRDDGLSLCRADIGSNPRVTCMSGYFNN